MDALSRRAFVTRLGAGAVVARLAGRARAADEPPPFPGRLGVCAGVAKAAELLANGAQYVEEGVQRFLVPNESDEAFAKNLEKAKAAVLPVPACNGFLPGSLKCVGPEANHEAVLKYAATASRATLWRSRAAAATAASSIASAWSLYAPVRPAVKMGIWRRRPRSQLLRSP